jgi:dienelactone hydrolase
LPYIFYIVGGVGTQVVREPVREAGLVGAYYRPDSRGPLPTVLVLGGGEGGLVEGGARSFAAEGYAALSLAYFGLSPLGRDLIEIPLEYFAAALRWLRGRPEADGDRAAVVGVSRGGELALLLASTYPQDVGAAVGYVPSSVVYSGSSLDPWGWSPFVPRRSAWTLGGKPLPFLDAWPTSQDLFGWQPCPSPVWPFVVGGWGLRLPISLRGAYERPLSGNGAALRRAAIPVERIEGPVLLVSGGQDALWPSRRLSEMAMGRLRFNRHPHRYEHLVYEEAGHMILPKGVSGSYVPPWLAVGGTKSADRQASADSWDRVLQFLGESLG